MHIFSIKKNTDRLHELVTERAYPVSICACIVWVLLLIFTHHREQIVYTVLLCLFDVTAVSKSISKAQLNKFTL